MLDDNNLRRMGLWNLVHAHCTIGLILGCALFGTAFAQQSAQQPAGQPAAQPVADDTAAIKASLYFHAPFDGGTDAKVARHDRSLYTAPNLKRESAEPGQHREDVAIIAGEGQHGDALRFLGKNKQVLFYPGANMDFRETDWQGTVSLWLRLTPDEDLKEGYSDPLQITDKAWNDASFFIDFDIDSPRTFRLGIFSEYKFWNPNDVKWEDWPVADRPMIHVPRPPLTRDRWTHVAWTFQGINAAEGIPATCRFYLDGKLQGKFERPAQFRWNLERTAIMLGLDYVGDLDELMLFDRALTEGEVARLTTFFNED